MMNGHAVGTPYEFLCVQLNNNGTQRHKGEGGDFLQAYLRVKEIIANFARRRACDVGHDGNDGPQ